MNEEDETVADVEPILTMNVIPEDVEPNEVVKPSLMERFSKAFSAVVNSAKSAFGVAEESKIESSDLVVGGMLDKMVKDGIISQKGKDIYMNTPISNEPENIMDSNKKLSLVGEAIKYAESRGALNETTLKQIAKDITSEIKELDVKHGTNVKNIDKPKRSNSKFLAGIVYNNLPKSLLKAIGPKAKASQSLASKQGLPQVQKQPAGQSR